MTRESPFSMRTVGLLVFSICALPAAGAVEMFLDLPGVPGESADSDHLGEIDVLAWSWGMSQAGSGAQASFQDLSVTKYLDKASPALMQRVADGGLFDEATLSIRKGGATPFEYVKVEMEDLIVSSVSTGGSGGEDRLTENVTLNFARFTTTVTRFLSLGAIADKNYLTWDIPTGTGSGGSGTPEAPGNTAPTISDVSAQTVDEDGSIEVAFVVTDLESANGALVVFAGSANEVLLPASQMTLSGGGSNRTVTFTPAPDQSGTVEVTLVVSDGVLTASDSFVLTVTAVNDAPTIGPISSQTTEFETALPLQVTVNDVDTSLASVSLSGTADPAGLIASITDLTGSGSARTLQIVPAPGAQGLVTITLHATDGSDSATPVVFALAINPPGTTGLTAVLLNGGNAATPISLAENPPAGTEIGVLDATDTAATQHTFAIVEAASSPFVIGGASGDRLQVGDPAAFDFETAPSLTVTIQATDAGDAARTRTETFTVDLTNVNEPTLISLPLTGFPEATPETVTPLGGIALADPDAGSDPIVFTLTAADSTLAIDASGALAGKVSGNGSGALVVTAPIAEINAVLAAGGLTLQSDPGFAGTITLNFATDDQGFSGAGGAQLDAAVGTIEVTLSRWERWRRDYFTTPELADLAISGFDADADKDGLRNGAEYGLVTSPIDPLQGPSAVSLSTIEVGGLRYPVLTFTRRNDDPKMTVRMEVATDNADWSDLSAVTEVSAVTLSSQEDRVTSRTTRPLSADPSQQLRLFFDLEGL